MTHLDDCALLAQMDGGDAAAAGGIGAIFLIVYLAIFVLVIAGLWKTFVKAGQPGWGPLSRFIILFSCFKLPGDPSGGLFYFLFPSSA